MRALRFSLFSLPFAVFVACGGVTDIDYQGPDASAGGSSGAGGTIIGGTGGGITDGGSGNMGGTGNVAGTGPTGGTGNVAGTGATGGTGVVCGGELCPPPSVPIGQVDSCCVGDKCGISSSFIGGQCIELGQEGKLDPTCPPQTVQGLTLQGCCKPSGMCGVLDTFIGVGCVDPSQFGVGTPTKCGGTGTGGTGGGGTGGTAAGGSGGTGGTAAGGTGGITDASVGGTGGVSADGGIPGEVYCDNSPNVIVCSAAQNCCLLNPGQEYCTPKATPCACTGANCDATTVSCDGPEDCSGGQICCGTFSQQANAYTTLKCQSTCGGQWEREICKPNGTCTTSGQTCSQSSFLTSYIWRCN
ncbi:MAG: hypothetical protein HS104_34645 [Polyangiaceae bacterium]|nr:hypothetical protein [Polyangiaceae bacterium]MCL4756133.1 hypothetical protein [Myxococcales bacterium]